MITPEQVASALDALGDYIETEVKTVKHRLHARAALSLVAQALATLEADAHALTLMRQEEILRAEQAEAERDALEVKLAAAGGTAGTTPTPELK